MLKLTRYLDKEDNEIFDLPRVFETDNSVTKYNLLTIYDDNHSNSDLANATEFSFTTDNLDIYVLPSESYLLVNLKLVNAAGAAYPPDANITITENAFNIFSEARLYLGDEEVERADHVGINTLLYNLTRYTISESNGIRESELVCTDSNFIRDYVVRDCHGSIELLLPIRKMFPFYHEMRHAFRGLKHRITMTLNQQNKMIYKWARNNVAAPEDGRIIINKMVWRLPHVEPSLSTMAKLESLFAKDSSFAMKWEAQSVLKFMPPKTTEIRVPIACSIHRPTHIFIAFQNRDRETDQVDNYMQFDNMSVSEISVELNGQKFPDKSLTCNFGTMAIQEVYQAFLNACTHGVTWQESYRNFIKLYPIFHIDVTKHPAEIFDDSNFPNIIINTTFRVAPARDYVMYVILYNIREVKMNILNKRMIISK